MKTILLLFLFTISVNCFSQDSVICFTIPEAQKIAMKINRCDYLETEIINLQSKDSLNKIQTLLFNSKINSLNTIIGLQDEQLDILEKQPKTVIERINFSGWHLAGAVILTSLSIWIGTQITK